MMMQSSIRDQKYLPSGFLAFEYPANVDARLRHEVPAELDDYARLRQCLSHFRHEAPQILANRRYIQCFVPGKIRRAETAAYVQHADWNGSMFRECNAQLECLFMGFLNSRNFQILGAAENMKSFEIECQFSQSDQHGRNAFGIHSKLLGTTAHFHAG